MLKQNSIKENQHPCMERGQRTDKDNTPHVILQRKLPHRPSR